MKNIILSLFFIFFYFHFYIYDIFWIIQFSKIIYCIVYRQDFFTQPSFKTCL